MSVKTAVPDDGVEKDSTLPKMKQVTDCIFHMITHTCTALILWLDMLIVSCKGM